MRLPDVAMRRAMAAPKTKTKETYNKDTLLDWYRQMVLIRQFETKCDKLYHDKKITGVYMHLYSGHEATGVGTLAALRESDHVITAYRDHGIALARGHLAIEGRVAHLGRDER